MKRTVLLLGVLAAGACTPEARTGAAVLVRDSAGVQIVESTRPLWSDGDAWRVDSVPGLLIGSIDGGSGDQLHRVGSVVRLPDGRIAVVNSGSSEVRLYAPTGQLRSTFGREGSGPGEFRFPGRIWVRPPDTLVVLDIASASLFDFQGTFIRSRPFGAHGPVGMLEDGRIVGMRFAAGEDPNTLGYSKPRMAVTVARPDALELDTLMVVSGGEYYRRLVDGNFILNYRAPFGSLRVMAVAGDSLYTGETSRFDVRVYDSSGRLARIMTRAWRPPPVTKADIDRLEAEMLGRVQAEPQRQQLRQLHREWTYPDVPAAYEELQVDHGRNVWLRQADLDPASQAEWTVFDPDGRWLGIVRMPTGLQVREIGVDFVLGVWTDELGVEYVRLHALVK